MFSFLSLQTRHQRAKKSCQVGGRQEKVLVKGGIGGARVTQAHLG